MSDPPRRMGRPSSLTPEVQARICKGLRLGLKHDLAAQYGGIERTTFYRWMNEGRDEKTPAKRDFYHAVKSAESEHAAQSMALILRAAQGQRVECEHCGGVSEDAQWAAAAWMMERRHGYTRTQKVEVEVDAHLQVSSDLDMSRLTDEELGQYRGLVEKMRAPKVLEMVRPRELEDRDGE